MLVDCMEYYLNYKCKVKLNLRVFVMRKIFWNECFFFKYVLKLSRSYCLKVYDCFMFVVIIEIVWGVGIENWIGGKVWCKIS